jgi:hypothetical protein
MADPHHNRLPELAALIKAADLEVKQSAAKMAESAIAAGRHLLEAKEAIGHGGWLPWLREHVAMSERSARRYMQLAKTRINSAIVADLGIVGAIARAEAIQSVPLPEIGEYILAADGEEMFLVIYHHTPAEDGVEYLNHAFVSDYGMDGTYRGVRKDRLREQLARLDDGVFDYARADFKRLSIEEDKEFLDQLHKRFWDAEVASWAALRESANA